MLYRVNVKTLERSVHFPFSVRELGIVSNFPQNNFLHYYVEYFEFTIRLNSANKEAIDIIDGKEYRTPFPSLIIKRPGMKHYFSVEESREAFYIQYPKRYLPDFIKMNLLPKDAVSHIELNAKINTLIRDAIAFIPHTREYGVIDRIDLLCFQIVQELCLQRNSVKKSENENNILKVASYLKVNFTEDINLDNIIDQYGFTRRTFFRHWNQHFSVSPVKYIQNLKINEAKRLLEETNMDITSISVYLNYSESTYFCRIFKREVGMSPGNYRETCQRNRNQIIEL